MKTTRESAREDAHRHVVKSLQELLEKNYDAEKDYKKAIERADKAQLKEFFKKQGLLHNHFATELDKEIHVLNEHPVEHSSGLNKLHRTWINLKNSIAGHKDENLLKDCLEGEKNCIKEYEEKLKTNHFPGHIDDVLRRQLKEMKEACSQIHSLTDVE